MPDCIVLDLALEFFLLLHFKHGHLFPYYTNLEGGHKDITWRLEHAARRVIGIGLGLGHLNLLILNHLFLILEIHKYIPLVDLPKLTIFRKYLKLIIAVELF